MKPTRTTLLFILLLSLVGLPLTASSEGQNLITREQAIDIALQRNKGEGKVLAVREEEDNNGARVFAVKVLTNGRVKVFQIPAKSK